MTHAHQIHNQQSQNQQSQTGSLDDLKAVDRLSEGAVDQPKLPESPSTNTDNAAHADLTHASLETVDETVCRPVPAKDLRQYLFLAAELQHTRERAREKFHSEQLSKELGLDKLQVSQTSTAAAHDSDLHSASDSTLVSPRVIAGLLKLLEISVDDWQEVTASASLPALLRAERSLKAMSLGLPKDATEKQIAVKQEARNKELASEKYKQAFEQKVKEADLVKQASERIEYLRKNSAHNTSAERDGIVHLHDVMIEVEYRLVHYALPTEGDTQRDLTRRMTTRGAILGAVSGAMLYGAAVFFDAGPLVVIGKHWTVLIATSSALAIFLRAVAGTFGEEHSGFYHRNEVVPSAMQTLAAQLTNSPAMQEVIKELEVKGVKCETRLITTSDRDAYLNVRLYIQEQR